jgi:hypothetical protein
MRDYSQMVPQEQTARLPKSAPQVLRRCGKAGAIFACRVSCRGSQQVIREVSGLRYSEEKAIRVCKEPDNPGNNAAHISLGYGFPCWWE